MPTTATRCYRFALRPSPTQAEALARATDQARRVWNELTALLRYAEREQRVGRREALLHEYGRILAGKALTGAAYTKARRLMAERGMASEAEALAFGRAEKAEAARKFGRRRLALLYAVERAQANAKRKKYVFAAQTVVAIVQRFAAANALYVTGKRGRPGFKRQGDPVPLQRQADVNRPSPVDLEHGTVDLAAVLGSECCRSVAAVLHRPLPAGAIIKQMAVTSTSARAFVTLMVEAPETAFVHPVPEVAPEKAVGIDPGRKTALTASDADGSVQFTIEPPLFRDQRFLWKMNRLQRRADRQLRAANPARFDEKGRWRRRGGPMVVSHGLRQTREKMADGLRHIADARREAYHLGANRLLDQFAVVGVGTWRGRGKAPGVGKSKRAQNRKDYDNALGVFTSILKDKAARSSQPRQVLDVREAYTTCTCPDCGEQTGPTGLQDLKVRVWTCTSCGQTHQRDFASARAIARRTLALHTTAAGAQPAQPEPSRPAGWLELQPRPTKVHARKVRAKSPSARNLVSEPERRSGVSAAAAPRGQPAVGVEVAPKPAPCSQPPVWQHQPDLPLLFQDAPCIHAAERAKPVHARRRCTGTVTSWTSGSKSSASQTHETDYQPPLMPTKV